MKNISSSINKLLRKEFNMTKLMKISLVTAMLATGAVAETGYIKYDSGTLEFSSGTNLSPSITANIRAYGDTISEPASPTTIRVGRDLSLGSDYVIALEPGSNGILARGTTLSNYGNIVMNYDADNPAVFSGGTIKNSTDGITSQQGQIQIGGLGAEGLTYYGSDAYDLEEYTAPDGVTLPDGLSPKMIVQHEAGFVPNLPEIMSTIAVNDGDTTKQFGADTASITGEAGLAEYLTGFGITLFKDTRTYGDFMDDSKSAAADVKYNGQTFAQVLKSAKTSDAVLVEKTVDLGTADVTVTTNMFNVDDPDNLVTFEGSQLTLSGNNSALQNAIMNTNVIINGPNALPTNATFNQGLRIDKSVTIGSGNTVTVASSSTYHFSISKGVVLKVNGGTLTL